MKAKPSEPGISEADLLKNLASRVSARYAAATTAKSQPVPPGWFNADEIAQQMGISRDSVIRKLRIIAPQTQKLLRYTGNHARHVTYYKI